MRKNILLIFFLYIITLVSCINTSDKLININKDYISKRSYFPKEFVAHFPDSIYKLPYFITVDTGIDLNHVFICLMLQELDSNLLENDILRSQKSFDNYFSDDSDLFVINKFTNEDNLFSQNKFPDNYEYQDTFYTKQPIPSFWFIEPNSNTICKLDKSFKLFVIESKQGEYWEKKYLTIYNQMPQNWFHGYSRGIAISVEKRTKIFWFAIW